MYQNHQPKGVVLLTSLDSDLITWRRYAIAAFVVLVGMVRTGPAFAQDIPGVETAVVAAFPSVAAVAAESTPRLDGHVLGDPAWADAVPATGFRQTAPDEGEAASERTEVRIIFTEDTIYFGVVCYDRDPGSIIVTNSRRDSSLSDSDSFQLILDTFRDRRNAFVFGTSPAGQEYDGQVVNEGVGGSGLGRGGHRAAPAAGSISTGMAHGKFEPRSQRSDGVPSLRFLSGRSAIRLDRLRRGA